MSKKFSDLGEEERKAIEDHVETISTTLGMEAWESYGSAGELKILKDLVGICYNCKYLKYARTEFGSVRALCEEFNCRLSGQNRVVECNLHAPKNVLTLTEMYAIAHVIDPAEEKIEGFISKSSRLRGEKK